MVQRPSTTGQLVEVFAQFQRMREAQPVSYDQATASWHLFRYDEVEQVLTNSTHFSAGEPYDVTSSRACNPLQHHLVRGLIGRSLTPHAVNQLAPYIRASAQTLLDQLRPQGSMDVIADLAVPLCQSVLAELVGIPADHRQHLQHWTTALMASTWDEQASRASQELSAYLLHLLEERLCHPEPDLLSRLLAANMDGAHLHEREMVVCCRLLLVSGQEPITNLLGNAILCLLEHPEVIERLRHEPAPIYSTIAEVLRYLPPAWTVHRTTLTEVTLGSQHIPAHARISAEIASANRDAKHFAQPEQFDIDRIPNRHLSFGDDSIHSCLGAGLTRLVARITLSLVVHQFTDLTLKTQHTLDVVDSPTLFGVKYLPITFRPMPQSSEAL